MYNAEYDRQSIRVVNHREDTPQAVSGFLIPATYTGKAHARLPKKVVTRLPQTLLITPRRRFSPTQVTETIIIMAGVTVCTLVLFTFGQLTLRGSSIMAAPVVVVASDALPETKPLHYGVQPAFADTAFYAEARDTFIAEKLTFVAVDLESMQLEFFVEGQSVFAADVAAKGSAGSWWQTPAGLYQVQQKKDGHQSVVGSVYQPSLITFGGNFQIHGWPKDSSGLPVPSERQVGGIRLSDEAAARLYELVPLETPVLVHERASTPDTFVYAPKVPSLTAPHYLVADVESNTVLAASDINEAVPIASITKLMTALVAAEEIDLDSNVYVSQEKYVTTLVPRLGGRYMVSMYSLLQLLLVESSNEAAEVIAAQVGRDRFITLMNEKALALGLSDTRFTDPSGLDDGNVSSLSDLMRLVQHINSSRSFILALTHDQHLPTTHVRGQFGELENFNLIDGVDSFIGGKVGETLAAGQTSVSLHRLTIDGAERTLAFIVLGSKERNADVQKLEAYVRTQFAE